MTMFLYARVSTSDQTLDHQLTQARSAGFSIEDDHVIADNGVSGVATRLCEREQGKRLFDLLRRGDTLVVRWVDRLGRNYDDVVETIQRFMKKGVIIRTVINGFTFDGSTKDPWRRPFGMRLSASWLRWLRPRQREPRTHRGRGLPMPRLSIRPRTGGVSRRSPVSNPHGAYPRQPRRDEYQPDC